MAESYQELALAGMAEPLDMTEHLSIERHPLLIINVDDIAPIPLHATQGGTGHLLILGAQAVVFEHGSEGAVEYASQMAEVLRSDVGVAPAPYHGGAFLGKQCHKISAKLELLCDLLDKYVSPSRAHAYCNACLLRASIIPALNRAEITPPDERASFHDRVAELVENLVADFEWCSVIPKLLILCCHAPDFLDRHGSIGLFSEQGLEAWHGHDNQNNNALVGPTFLERCVRLLLKSAVVCGEDQSGFKRGKRRLSAAPEARRATKEPDMRTTRAKVAAGSSPGESAACIEKRAVKMDKWADNVVTAASTKIAAHRRRQNKKTANGIHSAETESALMAAAEEECLGLLLEN